MHHLFAGQATHNLHGVGMLPVFANCDALQAAVAAGKQGCLPAKQPVVVERLVTADDGVLNHIDQVVNLATASRFSGGL